MSPVVVREGALVGTLVSQHLLEGPGEVTVPSQEVTSAMNVVRLLDVCHHKIVVTAFRARCNGGRGLCGQFVEAVDGVGKSDSLLAGQCCPASL